MAGKTKKESKTVFWVYVNWTNNSAECNETMCKVLPHTFIKNFHPTHTSDFDKHLTYKCKFRNDYNAARVNNYLQINRTSHVRSVDLNSDAESTDDEDFYEATVVHMEETLELVLDWVSSMVKNNKRIPKPKIIEKVVHERTGTNATKLKVDAKEVAKARKTQVEKSKQAVLHQVLSQKKKSQAVHDQSDEEDTVYSTNRLLREKVTQLSTELESALKEVHDLKIERINLYRTLHRMSQANLQLVGVRTEDVPEQLLVPTVRRNLNHFWTQFDKLDHQRDVQENEGRKTHKRSVLEAVNYNKPHEAVVDEEAIHDHCSDSDLGEFPGMPHEEKHVFGKIYNGKVFVGHEQFITKECWFDLLSKSKEADMARGIAIGLYGEELRHRSVKGNKPKNSKKENQTVKAGISPDKYAAIKDVLRFLIHRKEKRNLTSSEFEDKLKTAHLAINQKSNDMQRVKAKKNIIVDSDENA